MLIRFTCKEKYTGSRVLSNSRISDKNFAMVYHRVLAKETSFEDAARQFGEGPERLQGGLIPMQPLLSMPFGLGVVLERLRIGEISTPLRLGKVFCLVELLKFTPCKLEEYGRCVMKTI